MKMSEMLLKTTRRLGFGSSRLMNSRRGSAIVMAVVFTAIVASTVSYVLLGSNRQTRNTFRARLMDTSLAASAAVVKTMSQQAYYVATSRPAQLGGNFDQMDTLIQSIKPTSLPGYKAVKEGGKELVFLEPTSGNNGDWSQIDDVNDDWNGFTIRRWSYDAVAFMNAADDVDATKTDPVAERLGFDGAGFKSKVEINYIPLYMYAIFYDNDLEFHPGPHMAVEGPVHTNSTLWLAAGGGGSLSLNDRVSAAGNMRSYRDFWGKVNNSLVGPVNYTKSDGNTWNPEGSDHPGPVSVKKKNGTNVGLNNGLPAGSDSNQNTFLDSLDKNWMANALERFGGNLTDKAMGNKEIQPPLPFIGEGANRRQADASELIQRLDGKNPDMDKARMESFADIRITGDPSKVDKDGYLSDITIEVAQSYNSDGNVTAWSKTTIPNRQIVNGKPTGKPLVKPGSFTDYRENKQVKTFDIDMGEMMTRPEVAGSMNNGVIYASTKDSNNTMNAVRIINAEKVPTSPANTLTVATDRPMYLEGDVNTGAPNERATLLLAADAMYVTSKHLTDDTGRNSKAAGPVETNAIFMLGQVSSKYQEANADGKLKNGGEKIDHFEEGYRRYQWSGGVHNVLRYLENWSGINHTYNGSLICLFESRVATYRHQTDKDGDQTYYGAPKRDYNWDASLKNKVPPKGMPILVEVRMTPLERISKAEAVALAQ